MNKEKFILKLYQDGYGTTYIANILGVKYPSVRNEYIKPFIIGFIDGDGTLKYNLKTGYRFGIVGNKLTIDNISNLIKQLGFNKDFVVADNPIDKVWKRLCLYRKQDICDLVSLLEPNKYFYLKRKWQNYLDFLSAASI